jgi:hypothetical protein
MQKVQTGIQTELSEFNIVNKKEPNFPQFFFRRGHKKLAGYDNVSSKGRD